MKTGAMLIALFDLDHTLIPFDSGSLFTQHLASLGVLEPGFEDQYLEWCRRYAEGSVDMAQMHRFTVGLDPKSRRDLLAALHEDVRDRGVAVLWATHWVEEAADADRVLVLHKGRLLADGTPAEVTAALGADTLEAGFIARTS